jgi:hypothetical protein
LDFNQKLVNFGLENNQIYNDLTLEFNQNPVIPAENKECPQAHLKS